MGLKSLMEKLKKRTTDTPDTSEKSMGYQRKAPIHAGCTPDTPDTSCFGATRANALLRQFGEAVNDPASSEPVLQGSLKKPAVAVPDWRELDKAYQAHHFKCPTCIAAGRGLSYGLRCGTGSALWSAYSKAP